MKVAVSFFIAFVAFTLNVSGQASEAQMILEIDYPINCGEFNHRMDVTYQHHLQGLSDSKLYVVSYGARYRKTSVWNKKTNSPEKIQLFHPRPGEALNNAKEVSLYFETAYKFPPDKIVLIDGGFRENSTLELWIVPKDAEPPSPEPTIDGKDVRFGGVKRQSVRNCARAYDGYQ